MKWNESIKKTWVFIMQNRFQITEICIRGLNMINCKWKRHPRLKEKHHFRPPSWTKSMSFHTCDSSLPITLTQLMFHQRQREKKVFFHWNAWPPAWYLHAIKNKQNQNKSPHCQTEIMVNSGDLMGIWPGIAFERLTRETALWTYPRNLTTPKKKKNNPQQGLWLACHTKPGSQAASASRHTCKWEGRALFPLLPGLRLIRCDAQAGC